MSDFSFHASKLGIAGDALAADPPPSPRSGRVGLPALTTEEKDYRQGGWRRYLGSSINNPASVNEAHVDASGTRKSSWPRLPSFSISAQRSARNVSAPDASASGMTRAALPAHTLYAPPQESKKSRSRSMSLDAPRLVRARFNSVQRAEPASPSKARSLVLLSSKVFPSRAVRASLSHGATQGLRGAHWLTCRAKV